jgi:hypothetical protein
MTFASIHHTRGAEENKSAAFVPATNLFSALHKPQNSRLYQLCLALGSGSEIKTIAFNWPLMYLLLSAAAVAVNFV